MHKKISILLITGMLLISCTTLQKAKQVNARYYVKQELSNIKASLEESEPTGTPMLTLHLVDLAGIHTEKLAALAREVPDGSTEAIMIAQLMGDGEKLVRWSSDPVIVAQGYLLLGHWTEARRMDLHDPATDAMIYLAEGDTLKAIHTLEYLIVQSDVDRMIRLNGARQLCELLPDSYLGLKQVMMLTSNPWEQFTSSTLLDYYAGRPMRYDERDSRQRIFVKMLEAQKSRGEEELKEVSQIIKRNHGARPLHQQLRWLRQQLLTNEFYPEALSIHEMLSEQEKREYPYSLLEEYKDEIQLIDAYESSESEHQHIISSPQEYSNANATTFRGKWGDVRNVDNWAIDYSRAIISNKRSTKKPNKDLYNALRQHLGQQIPKP